MCEFLVVGDNDKCLPQFLTELEEKLVQFVSVFGVEASRWFVGEDDGRVVDECAGHCHSLFLSSRQFVGFMVFSVGQAKEFK